MHLLMTKPPMDIDRFTWDNLQSDIYLGLHANSMQLYLDGVVTPALNAIDTRHDELSRSDEPGAPFQLGDVEALRESTMEAFALSIQSQWERQLREFLKGCARELKRSDAYVASLATDNWSKLLKRFQDLRGIPLQAFDSFPALDLLQLLGNACRHGDGNSARKLYERRPGLWPNWPPAPPVSWPESHLMPSTSQPPFSQVSLSRLLLVRLAEAVIWFWEDHNYIYTNSIKRKHYSVEGALAKMRDERAKRRRL
jgi:hypothetical protein